MVEPEVAFLDFEGLQDLAEEFVAYIVGRVLERCQEELKQLERDVTKLEQSSAPSRASRYRDAIELLQIEGDARRTSATTSAATRRPSSPTRSTAR